MNERLTELKTKWSNHIAWGKLYGCLSSDQKELQLAWKDTQIVLFMTTLADARTTICRLRKKPNTEDKWFIETFGDQPFNHLEIPDFIDMYNHLMNGVDRADQIRTYYRANRKKFSNLEALPNDNPQRCINLDGPRPLNKEEGRKFEISYKACLSINGLFICSQACLLS